MAKYAEIKNGVVVGISYEKNSGWPEVPDTVFPGDIDNGDGTFSRPTPPAPTSEEVRAAMPSLTARQFRLGLLDADRTFAQVEAAIAAIPDEIAREKAMVEWEYAATFNRLHPLVVDLSGALGFTPEEVDTLWQSALNL